MENSINIIADGWEPLREPASIVRYTVFVQEQKIPAEIEYDDMDAQCLHCVAFESGGVAIGTGRLLPDGHIGRVAVVRHWRGKGIGEQLMRALLEAAKRAGHTHVHLSAQLTAQAFYERLGFEAEGDVYMDAGIEHRNMSKAIS